MLRPERELMSSRISYNVLAVDCASQWGFEAHLVALPTRCAIAASWAPPRALQQQEQHQHLLLQAQRCRQARLLNELAADLPAAAS